MSVRVSVGKKKKRAYHCDLMRHNTSGDVTKCVTVEEQHVCLQFDLCSPNIHGCVCNYELFFLLVGACGCQTDNLSFLHVYLHKIKLSYYRAVCFVFIRERIILLEVQDYAFENRRPCHDHLYLIVSAVRCLRVVYFSGFFV